MTFGFLNIDQSLKAVREDPASYQKWLTETLERDPLNAVVETFESSKNQGLLTGLPVLIKDNLCLKGQIASCGSRSLQNHKALYTSTVVDRLLKAGCVIKGRTNMDEFAMGSSTEYSAYGPTLNPWNPDYVPGGSSGGSAAAVAAGWVPAALGSDTGGSVRQPAAFCGVVGYKPTYGFLSRYGLVAFASSLDQVGLFTHLVSDAAQLMSAMAGRDSQDSTSLSTPQDWVLTKPNWKSVTIGILPESHLEGIQDEIYQSYKKSWQWFKDQGAQITLVDLPHFDQGLPTYYIVALAEASANLARYDGIRYGYRSAQAQNLHEVYQLSRSEGFGLEVKRRILLGTHVLSSGYYEAYYHQARNVQRQIQRDYEKMFESIDVLLTPTTRQTAFRLGEKSRDPVEMYKSDWFTVCANHAGLPALSVPVGLDSQELPMGLQFMGRFGQDISLLSIADSWQKAHRFSLRPSYV